MILSTAYDLYKHHYPEEHGLMTISGMLKLTFGGPVTAEFGEDYGLLPARAKEDKSGDRVDSFSTKRKWEGKFKWNVT